MLSQNKYFALLSNNILIIKIFDRTIIDFIRVRTYYVTPVTSV